MSIRLILLLLFLSSCSNSTGFKSEPKPNNGVSIRGFNKSKVGGLERNGVALKFYNINKMNTALLPRFDDIKKKKNKNLSKLVKNNKYYYSIGFGDFINIANTDLDGIEVSYTIGPDGNVTMSYIG